MLKFLIFLRSSENKQKLKKEIYLILNYNLNYKWYIITYYLNSQRIITDKLNNYHEEKS